MAFGVKHKKQKQSNPQESSEKKVVEAKRVATKIKKPGIWIKFKNKIKTYKRVLKITKKPSSKVFIVEGGKTKQSKELKNAISEVMDYIDYYTDQYAYELVKYKENVYKPKAIIIIGYSLNENERQKLRQHNSYLHRIEVLTYDDIANRAEAVIKFYEKSK